MKTIFKFVTVLVLFFGSFVFGQSVNVEGIKIYMNALNSTTEKYINKQISKDELPKSINEELIKQGVIIRNDFVFSTANFSDLYFSYEKSITATSNYETSDEYLDSLDKIGLEITNSKLSINEKETLLNSVEFEKQLVKSMETTALKYQDTTTGKKKSWWACWGQCAAGTLGYAIGGGIAGCGAIGGIGAIVGSVAPGPGNAVGAIAGCVGGGIVGAIGGGLAGAAGNCH